MITIGITGGVGSGKSSVLDYIKNHYSAYVILADEVGHQLWNQGELLMIVSSRFMEMEF